MTGDGIFDIFRVLIALALLAVLLAAFGVALWIGLSAAGVDIAAVSPADVHRFVDAWGAWSAAGAVTLMVVHCFLPLPAEIIPVVNGMMFGLWFGIALTWLGAMLGAVLSFALARGLGRPFLRLVLSENQRRRIDRLPVHPGALLVVRLVPLISFNLVNYAAGVLAVSCWTFLWTTAIGILPLTVAMVLIGSHMLTIPFWGWAVTGGAAVALWVLWRARRP